MGSETCGELTRSELNKEQNQLKPLLELWILVHKRLTFFSHYLHKTLTISETSNPVQSWHFDDKSEQVVNEGIKRLVSHHAPRKVSYWLQFIVDEKLRRHHNKTYTNIQQKISLLFTNKSVKMILVLRCDQSNRATWKYQSCNAFEWYYRIPWNIPRVTCIFWYTQGPLGECLYQENTSDGWDIPAMVIL